MLLLQLQLLLFLCLKCKYRHTSATNETTSLRPNSRLLLHSQPARHPPNQITNKIVQPNGRQAARQTSKRNDHYLAVYSNSAKIFVLMVLVFWITNLFAVGVVAAAPGAATAISALLPWLPSSQLLSFVVGVIVWRVIFDAIKLLYLLDKAVNIREIYYTTRVISLAKRLPIGNSITLLHDFFWRFFFPGGEKKGIKQNTAAAVRTSNKKRNEKKTKSK